MAAVAAKPLTAEEFFELPEPRDGSKQELVNGRVVSMPPPGCEHDEIQVSLAFLLKAFIKTKKLGRVVLESGVVTRRNKDSVRGPDVSYYSKKRMPLGRRIVAYKNDLLPIFALKSYLLPTRRNNCVRRSRSISTPASAWSGSPIPRIARLRF